MKILIPSALVAVSIIALVPQSAAQSARSTAAAATAETRAAVETAGRQALNTRAATLTEATAARDQATSQVAAAQDQVKSKLKLPFKLPKIEVPDVARAAKIRGAAVDQKVSSPRTLTYKSRASRLSRWIGPLTFGLLNYVPFETLNAGVSGTMNNLMAEEGISVESMAADAFATQLKEGQRWPKSAPSEGAFKIEINRYALDPVPTSISLLRPTVSLTGRLYDNDGKLLWIGKGFTTSVEPGIKGATLEQYEANPDMLHKDFETAVQTATQRLAAQANAVPKATVKVTAAATN
jgi:hypothetical protein